MEQSQLTPVSVGIATENKVLGSRELRVTPIETLPGISGGMRTKPGEVTGNGQTDTGGSYEVKTRSDTDIVCLWIPFGSNRKSPPDIRRGEQVLVYRLADTDRYYWTELGLNDDLRRLETATYVFNANPNLADDVNTVDNSYYFEISTHKKRVTFATCKKNGEVTKYDVQFDPGTGKLVVQDDRRNCFLIDTIARRIKLSNERGSFIEMIDRDVNLNVVQDLNITVGRNVKVEIKGEKKESIGKTLTTDVKSTSSHTVGADFSLSTKGSYNLNASGRANITGNGGIYLMNPVYASATIYANGIITGVPDVIGGGKSLKGHIHGNGNNGSPTTPPQ